MTDSADRALGALQRLLADAAEGGQAKVDALVALAQRRVYVPTWGGGEGFRTLVNSNGQTALPIFTDQQQFDEAATRFGWGRDSNEGSPAQEVGARQALRHAVAQDLPFVVVDIVSDHSLEITLSEIQPLLEQSPRHGTGPYAGVGKHSSDMLQAVRPTPRPEAPQHVPDTSVPKPSRTPALDPEGHAAPPAPGSEAGTAGATKSAQRATGTDGMPSAESPAPDPKELFAAPGEMPADALFDELTTVMRGFPEVEWASLGVVPDAAGEPTSAVGVRIDTNYRERVHQIAAGLRNAGIVHGTNLQVVLLDDSDLLRAARDQGAVFYPWRRK